MDTTNWKWFGIQELFHPQKCKCSNATELLTPGSEIAYIGAKKSENGVMSYVKRVEELVTNGNCIVFIGDGQGSVGYSTYQPKDFIGSTTLLAGYNPHLNAINAQFIVSILDCERFRYSFGRKYNKQALAKTKILLPAISDTEPDWQYMENFVKNTIIPQLPKRANEVWIGNCEKSAIIDSNLKLSFDTWHKFELKDLFTISRGHTLTSNQKDNIGKIPCVNGSLENNGILCYLDESLQNMGFELQPIPSLSLCRVGSSGTTFVQETPYYIADNAFCLLLKEKQSKYVYLFLSTILNKECYKYSYGRTISSVKYMQTQIMLPAILQADGSYTPDWQFMEDYIKSLPYSKNI